jgi:hypothetical protein
MAQPKNPNPRDYCDPSNFDDRKDWFNYCRESGKEAKQEGLARVAPFSDFDACDEFYSGYDSLY